MNNRNLIKLLKRIRKNDFNKLKNYLELFYPKQELLKLFLLLHIYYPTFSSKKANAQIIWHQLFPDTEFDDSKFTTLIHKLYQKVKEFIAWLEMRNDKVIINQLFFNFIEQRNYEDLYEEEINTLELLIQKDNNLEIWRLVNQIKLNHHRYFNTKSRKDKENIASLLEALLNSLNKFYLTYRTLIEVERLHRGFILQKGHGIILELDEIKALNKSYTEKDIMLFQNTLELFLDEEVYLNKDRYVDLKEKVFKSMSELHQEDKAVILNFLLNLTNTYTKQGFTQFAKKSFELFHICNSEGIFVKNKTISNTFFNNAIDTACKVGEIKWAREFLSKNKKYLRGKFKVDTLRIADGVLKFEEEDFGGVETVLRKKSFNLPEHKLRSRWLLIKSYYEMDNAEFFFQECDNTKQFLYNNSTFSQNVLTGTRKFVDAAYMLYSKSHSVTEIQDFVKSSNPIFQKTWLFQKLEEK